MGASASGEPSQEEAELRVRLEDLAKQFRDSQVVLDEEKQKTAELEDMSEMKRKQAEDLQVQIEHLKKGKRLAKRGCLSCSCIEAFSSKETRMMRHLNQIQDELTASQAAVENLQGKRKELEAKVELQEVVVASTVAKPVEDSYDDGPLFGRALSFFRAETPAVQRNMKSKIHGLIQDLESIQEEMEVEREMQQHAEFDSMHQEANAIALEAELRGQMRIDRGLDQQLKQLAQSNDRHSEVIATSFRKMFKGETPQRQREMKMQMKAFYSDLVVAEKQAAEEHIAHGTLRERMIILPRQCSTPRMRQNSFAFRAPDVTVPTSN
jgi:hypothetical protein